MRIIPLYGYKKPYTAVEKGYFGHQGVLLYDKVTDKLQCHICGKWFVMLAAHISISHKEEMDTQQYKEKFGFYPTTALVGERRRLQMVETTVKRIKEGTLKFVPGKNKGAWKTARNSKAFASMQYKNKKSICPEQILDRIKKLAEEIGRTPTSHEFGHRLAVKSTHGTYRKALQKLGMVPPKHGNKPRFDEPILLKTLDDFVKHYKRVPVLSDCRRGLLPAEGYYRQHFGSWGRAKKLMGFPVYNWKNKK